ncbi:MAG TPA: hypothetical protein VFA99_14500 [Acidobacteriaceae bacterium]|nr:hypothetical protein [Acidobacteriaceae bacterium]
MAKVGGGVDPMHLSNTAHPFGSARGMKATSKFAKTVGVGPNPGGNGDKISANAAMKKKRPLNGPGDAK